MAATKIDPSRPDPHPPTLWDGGGFGRLLAITPDSDNPEWDHRSLQLLMEEVGHGWLPWTAAEHW